MVLIIDSGKNVTDIKRRKNIVLNSKNDAAFYFNFFLSRQPDKFESNARLKIK